MYCSYCGAENPKYSKFCGNCGEIIKVEFTSKTETNSNLDYHKENIKMQLESLKIQQQQLAEQKNNLKVWLSVHIADLHLYLAIKKDLE